MVRLRYACWFLLIAAAVALVSCRSGVSAPGTQQVTVTASDYRFEPSTVSVKAGQAVQLTLRNTSSQVHDWTPQGLGPNVQALAQPGQTVTISFTPTAPGSYRVVCAQPGHEQVGMVGELTVTS